MRNIVRASCNLPRGRRRVTRLDLYWIMVTAPTGKPLLWMPNNQWGTYNEARVLAGKNGSKLFGEIPRIHTVKAAIRHAKKHTELPIGSVLVFSDLETDIRIRITGKR